MRCSREQSGDCVKDLVVGVRAVGLGLGLVMVMVMKVCSLSLIHI